MGSICPCFGKEPEYTYAPVPTSNSERTPLLASGSYGATKPRMSSTTYNEGAVASARSCSSPDPPDKPLDDTTDEKNGVPKSGSRCAPKELYVHVHSASDMRQLSVEDVGVPNLDKQFKDHVVLFNEYLDKYNQLKSTVNEMMAIYDNTGATPSTLGQVFSMILGELNEDARGSLKITRKFKYCMELDFEAKFLNGSCVAVLDGFNKANRLVKYLVEKGPTLVQTVTMVVENEEQAKRDVTVYYTEQERTEQGPEKLKVCLNNIGEMKRVKPAVQFIRKEASGIFEQLKDAAQILFNKAEDS